MTIKLGHLAPILLIALPLAACTKAESKSGNSILSAFGVTTSVDVPVYGIAEVSGETEAVVVPVAEPAPPVCENYVWRAVIYTCDGVAIGEIG